MGLLQFQELDTSTSVLAPAANALAPAAKALAVVYLARKFAIPAASDEQYRPTNSRHRRHQRGCTTVSAQQPTNLIGTSRKL
jgi:hypothetical protein